MSPAQLVTIERAARLRCKTALALGGATLGTTELAIAIHDDMPVLDVAHALVELASNGVLADCATRGEPEQRMMYGRPKMVRPWRWHRPTPCLIEDTSVRLYSNLSAPVIGNAD